MDRKVAGALALCLTLACPVRAEPPASALIATPPQPSWTQLTGEQRSILAPLAGEWDRMEHFRRKKWLGIALRYPALTPDTQQRLQQRMRTWATMTPEQRQRARDGYREFSQLPPEKRRALREQWDARPIQPKQAPGHLKQDTAAPDDTPTATSSGETRQPPPGETPSSPSPPTPRP